MELSLFTKALESEFPPDCAYSWDNSGLVLTAKDTVSSVLTALELTDAVLKEAVSLGCDLVLTHHPPIFSPVKRLAWDDPVTGLILRSAKAGISLYAAHTSCDCAPGGLNFALGDALGLFGLRVFAKDGCEHEGGGLGVVGTLKEAMDAKGLCLHVMRALGARAVRRSSVEGRFIKIAVIGGAGGYFYAEAARQGIYALVTGEAKHNDFIEATEAGVLLIAAGHAETERIFTRMAADRLSACGMDIKVFCSESAVPERVETDEAL